jgi:hypothetical protein
MTIMLSNQEVSYLRYLDGKIKDAEAELEYLGRCFTALDDKPNKTDGENKELRRVLKKIKTANSELTDLWNKKEEVTRDVIVI